MAPKALGKKSRPVIFGEVLFDLFPSGQDVLGGAPFNVAMHLAALGESPLMITRVGADRRGKLVRERMVSWKMDTSQLQMDREHETGFVQVSFENKEPHYSITPGVAWDFIEPPSGNSAPDHKHTALLYHGTLALRYLRSRKTLAELQRSLNVPTFVDLNLRNPWYNSEKIEMACSHARWLKLNRAELKELTGGVQQSIVKDLEVMRRKWDIAVIVVTDGANGAVYSQKDREPIAVKPKPLRDLVDTVGAGDAFSAVLIIGLLKGWDAERTVKRATEFASRVCTILGALPNIKAWYQSTLEAWSMEDG
ncbi:MAG: PfkB family carbohydrate kinase [bacterium]